MKVPDCYEEKKYENKAKIDSKLVEIERLTIEKKRIKRNCCRYVMRKSMI